VAFTSDRLKANTLSLKVQRCDHADALSDPRTHPLSFKFIFFLFPAHSWPVHRCAEFPGHFLISSPQVGYYRLHTDCALVEASLSRVLIYNSASRDTPTQRRYNSASQNRQPRPYPKTFGLPHNTGWFPIFSVIAICRKVTSLKVFYNGYCNSLKSLSKTKWFLCS